MFIEMTYNSLKIYHIILLIQMERILEYLWFVIWKCGVKANILKVSGLIYHIILLI